MNKQHFSAILAITTLAFSTGTIAQNMSESEYKAAEKDISNEYKSDQMKCGSFDSNDRDICMAVAKGKEKFAKSKLEARFKPSYKAAYQASVKRNQWDQTPLMHSLMCIDEVSALHGRCEESRLRF